MKKAIVTGAAGFLGRYCARELADQGYTVLGLDIIGFEDFKDWGLSFYTQSECKIASFEKTKHDFGIPEVIIHCAGSGSVPLSYESPYQDFVSNVNTTLEVLEFCRIHCPDIKLVIPSSAAVYGTVEKMPISEKTPLAPVSPYGCHKKIIEELALSYSANFKLKVSLVRLFSLYGKGLRKQIFWDACEKARNKNFNFSGKGEEIRDFLHVEDAAKLLTLAAKHSSDKCPIVNGGTGQGKTIREIVEIVGSNFTPQIKPHFSNESRLGDPAHFVADISLITSWGFHPQKDLSREIKNYINWYQEVKNND